MKIETLKNILKTGKKPMVRITDYLWDESFGRKGMIAQVTSYRELSHDDLVEFTFDYNSQRQHNLALDEPNWYLNESDAEKLGRRMGTAIESGHFKSDNLSETVIFDPRDLMPVELAEDNVCLNEYLKSNSTLTYVEWLENKCLTVIN
jgi:hypothetical protein